MKFPSILLLWVFFAIQFKALSQDATIFEVDRKPVRFTHQPFLLLKVTPTSFFEGDRNFRYGIELAPPFGKFSFAFDYGSGKNTGIWRDAEKFGSYERTNTQYRGEIRMYWSDWYPFYALDKKPLGRYYAIEYVHKTLGRNHAIDPSFEATILDLPINTPGTSFEPAQSETVEQAINIKIGKHFHITRFLFIDAFAGLGIGRSINSPLNYSIKEESEVPPPTWTFGFPNRNIAQNQWILSRTAGLKLCLVL